jgi:hypothetical protein
MGAPFAASGALPSGGGQPWPLLYLRLIRQRSLTMSTIDVSEFRFGASCQRPDERGIGASIHKSLARPPSWCDAGRAEARPGSDYQPGSASSA